MTVSLLVNSIGNAATSIGLISGASESGYSLNDLIAAARNYYWRSEERDAATSTILYYEVAASTAIDFVVIGGAHKLLTTNTMRVRVGYNNDAGSTLTTLLDLNPIAAANLLGPKAQDYVGTFDSASCRRAGLTLTTKGEVTGDTVSDEDKRRAVAGTLPVADSDIDASDRAIVGREYPLGSIDTSAQEAAMFSKLYFGAAFDFGVNPQPGVVVKKQTERRRPLKGVASYLTEARLTFTWNNITKAKLLAFESLLLRWPLFIYDSSADILKHKLEHCIVADPWRRRRRGTNAYDLELTVCRLKQYAS